VRGWLLDTNVLSELRKPRPDANVKAFVAQQPGELLFVTEITFGEIRYGIEQVTASHRRADLHSWLDRTLRPLFAGRVLPVTEDVFVRWKTMVIEGRRRGHTFGQPDLFIAAIAAMENLVVVSRDTADFIAAEVPVFNPWDSSLHWQGKTIRLPATVTLESLIKATRRA
jgi:toxin FitB